MGVVTGTSSPARRPRRGQDPRLPPGGIVQRREVRPERDARRRSGLCGVVDREHPSDVVRQVVPHDGDDGAVDREHGSIGASVPCRQVALREQRDQPGTRASCARATASRSSAAGRAPQRAGQKSCSRTSATTRPRARPPACAAPGGAVRQFGHCGPRGIPMLRNARCTGAKRKPNRCSMRSTSSWSVPQRAGHPRSRASVGVDGDVPRPSGGRPARPDRGAPEPRAQAQTVGDRTAGA